MKKYSLQDAQHHLKQLFEDAQQGMPVFISDENDHVVRLVPVTTPLKPRKAGSARGLIKIAPDFDEPLADFDELV